MKKIRFIHVPPKEPKRLRVAAYCRVSTRSKEQQVQEDGRNLSTAYKRTMNKKGFFRSYEYVYDEYYNCVIYPNNQILKYSTTIVMGTVNLRVIPQYARATHFETLYTKR